MIDRKLIASHAASCGSLGMQIHVNHTGCSAGEDKKRRLYIKRTSNGLVAYCHHCNEAGFASDDKSRLSTWLTTSVEAWATHNLPPILEWIKPEAGLWLFKHHCRPNNKHFNGVVGKPDQVALTLRNPENEPIGWQVRNLKFGATPKYITTYSHDRYKGDAAWFPVHGSTLFITEDYLSAYRIQHDTGINAVALLRTSITDKTLLQIYDLEFENIFIWLDPDEAGVKGAAKIEKELKHFLATGTKIKVINIGKEPKECSTSELIKIVSEL